ncbi:hypothetical protein [Erythrobacter sp.]|uniref:hypothetical protein n=1 Tax=Erythrobacter sp. TaxID=1042 RepID=UPI0025E091AB|nr:hypothetical protein [Erythrobacter sp.]
MLSHANQSRMGFRHLDQSELALVTGGSRLKTAREDQEWRDRHSTDVSVVSGDDVFKGADAIWFYDANGDGKASEGEVVDSYEKDGVHYNPEAWAQNDAFHDWVDSDTRWADLGGYIDETLNNPWTSLGTFFDNISDLMTTIDLDGSEYIDWKTGGAHRGVDGSNDLLNDSDSIDPVEP